MLKNYFTTALRSFRRNKFFTAINLLSLSLGISASLIIYLMVHYDFSFEKFQKDGDRIYRIVTIMHFPDQPFRNSGVPSPLPAALRNDLTGIEEVSHFILYELPTVTLTDQTIYKKQPNIIFADDHYFNLFQYQWIAGTPASLKEPNRVVLTESRAKTYFPDADFNHIAGEKIIYNDSVEATVAGIVKDITDITDFTFKEFISLPTLSGSNLKNRLSWDQWGNVSSRSQCFIKLNQGTSPSQIEMQLAELRKKYVNNDFLVTDHLLQPLRDIHFTSDYDNFDQRQGNVSVLYSLLFVAGFLLLLGCINFINLNTAVASQRAKEIGIRKTMGGSRKQLIIQFMAEAFLLTFISVILSLLLMPSLLKIFSDFIPAAINIRMLTELHVIVFLLLLMVIITMLAGFYPALVLSGYRPVTVLKNQVSASNNTRKSWLRKSLTVTQFAGAQFFIIATILVSKQIHYSINKDSGFRKDAIITINAPYTNDHSRDLVFLEKLKAIPQIEKACFAGTPPATSGISVQTMSYDDGRKKIETTVETKYADSGYFDLYGIKLLAGRYLKPSDSVREYLVNETFARALGFQHPEDAIGKMLTHGKNVPIVGVLKDFNSKSTHTAIGQLVFTASNEDYYCFHIQLRPQNSDGTVWPDALRKIEFEWKNVYPDRDFAYQFFDESIASFYESERRTSQLLTWATALAIFISCLGLIGLAVFTTHQRTKEIGVRKVLGATVEQIVVLLTKDFMQLIVLAFLIAVPLAWWAMHHWLQSFAYRTSLDWWVFAAGGLMMLMIALTILCVRTIRAASVNPVESLRSE